MKNRVFQKSNMKVGGQEVAENGCGASEDVESGCSGDGFYRKNNTQ